MKKYGIVAVGIVTIAVLIGIRFTSTEKVIETPPAPAAEPSDEAPQFQSKAESSLAALPHTNSAPPAKTALQRIAENDASVFKLSPEQVQAFLAKNATNAESLLAAFNVTGNKDFLREAMRQFPNSSFVLASVLANDALPD